MTGRPNDRLNVARQRAGLSLSELWERYFAAGGDHGAIELDAVLNGALQATRDEFDLIAQVLNERFTELGAGTPVPYEGEMANADSDLDPLVEAVPAPRSVTPDNAGSDEAWVVSTLNLQPDTEAPSATRRWARQLLLLHGRPNLIDVTASGLTELVTNACLHARTPMTVTMTLRAGSTVRFHVRDLSPLMPVRRNADVDATSGRGLQLVAACGEWGVQEHPDGKSVWLEPRAPTLPTQT